FVAATLALGGTDAVGVGAAFVSVAAPAAVGLETVTASVVANTVTIPDTIRIGPRTQVAGGIRTADPRDGYTLSATPGELPIFKSIRGRPRGRAFNGGSSTGTTV